MSINLTDELDAKTKKGKLGAAKQIYLDGDTKNLQQAYEETSTHFSTLDNRSSQMEKAIQDISTTGGASTANAVSYDNATSKLEAINIQGAVDEVSSTSYFAKRGSTINISTNYNSLNTAEILTLSQAINKISSKDRVLGFQGKYLASDGWHTIIYTGDSLTNWSDKTKWIDLADKIFNSVSNNATFAGIAIPTTDPKTPDAKVFYIANGKGTYEKFGGLEVTEDDVVVLYYDTAWHKEATGIASEEKLAELNSKINGDDKSYHDFNYGLRYTIIKSNIHLKQGMTYKFVIKALGHTKSVYAYISTTTTEDGQLANIAMAVGNDESMTTYTATKDYDNVYLLFYASEVGNGSFTFFSDDNIGLIGDVKVIQNDVDSVKGEVDVLNGIIVSKEYNENYSDRLQSRFLSSKGYVNSGSTGVAATIPIPIVANTKYKWTIPEEALGTHKEFYSSAIVNADGSIISLLYVGEGDFEYTPNTDEYIVLSGYTNKSTYIISYIGKGKIQKDIDKLKEDVKVIQNDVEVIPTIKASVEELNKKEENFYGKNYDSEIVEGKFINTSTGIGGSANDIRTNSIYNYIKLSVKQGDTFYITGTRGSSTSATFALADENLKWVEISDKSYDNEKVVISQDGWMICNFQNNRPYSVYKKNYYEAIVDMVDKGNSVDDTTPYGNGIVRGGALSIFRRLCIIGDSLSAGTMVFGASTETSDDMTEQKDMYDLCWGKFLAKECNNEPFIIAQGGLAARTFFDDNRKPNVDNMNIADAKHEDNTAMPFHEQLTCGKYNSDCYLIALGHNDFNMWKSTYWNPNRDSWASYLGSTSDINLTSGTFVKSFYGYYAKIIYTIKQQVPNAKIFLITMKQEGVSYDGGSAGVGSFKDLNNAIRYMATIFNNIYVLDMAKERNKIPDWHYTKGHGNALGYREYGAEIGTYANWIIMKNPLLFGYTQLINTQYANRIPTDVETSIGSEPT